MFLIFDTETTGLPKNYNAPLDDFNNWPRLVQIAWQIHNEKGELVEAKNFIIKPEGYEIPFNAVQVHGISTEKALTDGIELNIALKEFADAIDKVKVIAGHNIEFDLSIVGSEFLRKDIENKLFEKKHVCTKVESTEYLALPGGKGGKYKWPNLKELHTKLFNEDFQEAHNAMADVMATARCFLELVRIGIINEDKLGIEAEVLNEFRNINKNPFKTVKLKIETNKDNVNQEPIKEGESRQEPASINGSEFTHLHVHTQYSILDGAADIKGLIKKSKEDGMNAIAITDHGNMFGAKLFHKTANNEGIKPILGCEVYVARRSRFEKNDKVDASGDHLVLLAKNETGYFNLIKMVSYGWLEGFYYNPRIDKELLKKYSEGLIALTACLGGEVAQRLKNEGIEEGEKAIIELKEIFGEDLYLELQRHKSGDPEMDKDVYESQVFVNKNLMELGKKHHIKIVATNDVHFIEPEDAAAQDRLLCISTAKDVDDPNRLRYTQQEWMKTQDEMRNLFADIPEAIINTQEVVNKIEKYKLNRGAIMPDFKIPEDFNDADEYLKHITYEGAKKRWPDLTNEIKERIDFELETIKKMGFPGYFLIVWDFLKAAREMGVAVGPGRGSAAGSVVAYCLRITEINPLKYNLLFERFLNPDRVSMPDIDIDFDEDGRAKVMEYVVNKYGANRVAHIITFGSMAAKSAIRDVARVQGLPLPESDRLAKLVPERPGVTLKEAYKEVPELKKERDSDRKEISSVLKYAEVLEGSVRNTGTHACGVIIGRDDLENYIPISTTKDSELTYVTQYDGKHVEDIGLLKMDFLGLKTLSIIKDAVENVKLSKGIELDIDNIPLDDEHTYELYSNGETTGLFQFESDGMKKYLRELKPTKFEDLIAMNALYRPGPMDYIPDFVARKHGKQKIQYDLPEMKEYLEDTYGITVYQEQVMLLARKLAGFTRGESDSLRKAMGKKIKSMMDELKIKFVEGCEKNGFHKNTVEKIWNDWEKFALYAFNKSHATCYSYVSYQTAYLKAHYPAEFMAAVLSRNLSDIKKITFFMDECKRMGIKVLGPDVNESYARFVVNKKGNIRIGMAAIKGVGESAVNTLIEERESNGAFNDIFNFIERVNLHNINKKSIESLALAGALDCFSEIKREHFDPDNEALNFTDEIIRYGNNIQNEKNSSQQSLFGESNSIEIAKVKIPDVLEWNILKKLNLEKEYVGIYHSAHPLDDFKFELNHFCTHSLSELKNLNQLKDKEIMVGGMVTSAVEKITKTNKPYGTMTIEDFTDSYNLILFSKDYLNYKQFFTKGYNLLIRGRVQAREWGDTNELEFKIKMMQMLSDSREDLVKSVSINIELDKVTEDLINEIEEISVENAGNAYLKFIIFDPTENIKVDMFSRNYRVNLSEKFVDYLEGNPDLQFQIN